VSFRDEDVSFSLEVNVEKAYENIRRLQTVLYRTLGLLRRMGLSEELDAQIMQIQSLIAVVNSLRLAYIALQAARMAAGDPIAWGMAGVSVASAGFDLMQGVEWDWRAFRW